MKTAFSIYFILLFLSNCFSQTNEENETIFWKAVQNKNYDLIIEKGSLIINFLDESKNIIDNSNVQIRILTAIGFYNKGNYTKALEINLNTYKLIENNKSLKNNFEIALLNNIATNYSKEGDYNLSLEYNNIVLEKNRKISGKTSSEYAISLNNIALNYLNLGEYKKALEFNKAALKIREKKLGQDHPDYAISLNNIADIYCHLGEFKKALEYNLLSLDILEKTLGRNHPNYMISLNNLALNYADLGDYKKALELCKLVVEKREKTLGNNHPDYAISIDNVASIYLMLGDYKSALEFNQIALEIREKNFGQDHPDYALSLNNISCTYVYLGDFNKALEYNLKDLELREKLYGKVNLSYAKCLNNISINYAELGNFNEALEYGILSQKIKGEIIGTEHLDYAISEGNLATIYSDFGDYQSAINLNIDAIEIFRNSDNISNQHYATCLNNLASNYRNIGELNKSLEYNLISLNIRESTLGKKHPEYANSLTNVALVYADLGEYSKALKYNLLANSIIEKKIGKENSIYANNLNNIADIYSKIGDFRTSLEFNLSTLEITDKIFTDYHPDYLNSLKNCAFNYSKLGQLVKTFDLLNLALISSIGSYELNEFGISLNLNLIYKRELELTFHLYSSIAAINNKVNYNLYNYWINFNGKIDYKNNQIKELIYSGDNQLLEMFNELKATKRLFLSKQEINNNHELNEIKRLENHIFELEAELSKRSKEFTELSRDFTVKDITNNLNKEEIFIDISPFPFYDFTNNRWSDSIYYHVFISHSSDTLFEYVLIQNGDHLEKNILADCKYLNSNKSTEPNLQNEVFYNSLWKPIADKIGDTKTIYVSLGGVYNNINLNTLYNPETGKYLIEEKDIHIVNSARDFVLSKEREKKQYTSTTSALYGFPDFNGNATQTVDSIDFLASTRDLDQMWIDSLSRGGMKASSLPATKVEVEQIAGTFQKNGWKVTTYTGENASETNIKKEASPRVLHVATHGYFFEDIPLDTIDNLFLGMDRNRVVQDPMLRSGLLFTGANKTLQGEESRGENGLLSAAEASLLDLRETELVVLSACETGKGEVKNSEGVYGLRKAFADAGAKNIIMSLWKVDDKITQEFMTRFYEIWLNEKTTIREAFNRTQLEIKAKYPLPYYWGAFILVGEC
jgi:CHAT domain-containing protein